MARIPTAKTVETLVHEDEKRKNIPTAEYQSLLGDDEKSPIQVAYERRNRDLDPQLVWRGKDEQDWSDLIVQAPPLYIQEKVHPKVLIDDLRKRTEQAKPQDADLSLDLFADFNGVPEGADKTEFYQHDQNWTNRMILGDSLQVMARLATDREGLCGKVQCIYFDPPYGIKFNSNFQWSTTDKSGSTTDSKDKISREPEQVKAFRDTWRDGIHSYLAYLRDRLTVARDLLTESGSIFFQIGDDNVHRVRALMDELFGDNNYIATITCISSPGLGATYLQTATMYVLWFSKNRQNLKYRSLYTPREVGVGKGTGMRFDQVESPFGLEERTLSKEEKSDPSLIPEDWRPYKLSGLYSAAASATTTVDFTFRGKKFHPGNNRCWKTTVSGMDVLAKSNRLRITSNSLNYKRFIDDFPAVGIYNVWDDVKAGEEKIYVVQSVRKIVDRCVLMSTDPGDLVLDPTCGSGTTAYVAEQWGRRWITIDTSRVALALARARIMGARYPFYLLADSKDGQQKEAEVTRTIPSSQPTHGNIRHGFVYERVPHITLKSIANNSEIDVIWERSQETLEPLRAQLNAALGKSWEEWEIPREASDDWDAATKKLHGEWWKARIGRQKEIDASIAAKAEFEYLYDKPYEDRKTVRVAGPFTVESLSPHRVLGVDENDELIDHLAERKLGYGAAQDFTSMILENLRAAGVQQAHKDDKLTFLTVSPWPGDLVCAEGIYQESEKEKRAAIFIGPEFGTVSRPDLVEAAREAGDAGFDVLIACAFNFEAHTTEFVKLGRVPVLKARMNADLHMADDLKSTGKGNLFVIFGEPDIELLDALDGQLQVKVNGVDVFHPNTGEVRSDGADGIACWFLDTDYNQESFFVRHAYFLGANDPYSSLNTSLKAEINEEAWSTLHSDISRPFDKPLQGRIAVKVINHLGDEVMKVFKVL